MVLPKAKKVNKNHKSTGINLPQKFDDKKNKQQNNLNRDKWKDRKTQKGYTRREFTE